MPIMFLLYCGLLTFIVLKHISDDAALGLLCKSSCGPPSNMSLRPLGYIKPLYTMNQTTTTTSEGSLRAILEPRVSLVRSSVDVSKKTTCVCMKLDPGTIG